MSQFYFDPARANDPHALPDAETFRGYAHQCSKCEHEQALFPDYYGLLYQESEACDSCGSVGTLKVQDTKAKWYWQACFPGCLPDGEPKGPFATEADAIADAQSECAS